MFQLVWEGQRAENVFYCVIFVFWKALDCCVNKYKQIHFSFIMCSVHYSYHHVFIKDVYRVKGKCEQMFEYKALIIRSEI